ncbi:hypothetical protein BJV78DRAFT_344173 [Lactifluus subvellereus]|nr:hypothetical protein BJV78DRAFT_344173 [Lactifluus subvellereus]
MAPSGEEIHEDPSTRMWTLSLAQSAKHDKEMTENWKDNTKGVLVFTGLFSATVAAFIIEGYKKLSPDTGEQTVVLLNQLSQQLVGISNGTPLQLPPTLASSPHSLNVAIRVNIMWLLSLALSITCALAATLMQQWSRQYMEVSQHPVAPHQRALVRMYLFLGIRDFHMKHAVEAIPVLLHVSVFLFFAGLVDFLLPINKTVAWAFLGYVMLFAVAYIVITILPNLLKNCPYRTPFSGPMWRLWEFLVRAASILVQFVLRVFLLCPPWRGAVDGALFSATSVTSTVWRARIAGQITAPQGWLRSVVIAAISAAAQVNKDALTWTIEELDDDRKIEDFVACIPGFFNSNDSVDACNMLDLMDPSSNGRLSVLALRIRDLLKTCHPEMSRLDPMVRKGRLHACLVAIWYYAREYCKANSKWRRMPKYFQMVFADSSDIDALMTDEDKRTKTTVLCIRSLVSTTVINGIHHRLEGPQVLEGESAFLEKTIGSLWQPDLHLADHGPAEVANLVALLEGIGALTLQDVHPGEILGPEVSETLDIQVKIVLDTLSVSIKQWGSTAASIRHSCEVVKQFLLAYEGLNADTRLEGLMRRSEMSQLVEKLKILDPKLAHCAALYDLPESPL